MKHYPGGIAEWREKGGPIETAAEHYADSASLRTRAAAAGTSRRTSARIRARNWENRLLDRIGDTSTSRLFLIWLGMVLLCGVLYWLDLLVHGGGLLQAGKPLAADLDGLITAVYFSFATATSVGYGDIVPVGMMRLVAMAEAIAALLIFGAVIAKFVSRRQDKLVREIHQVSFEERLDRVQINLHTVFGEIQMIAALASAPTPALPEQMHARLESAALVFAGELRTVHHLLYHPYRRPEEQVMESILASLSASLRALGELLKSLPAAANHSPMLSTTVRGIARLSREICSDCVPHAYAPALAAWMDRIHDTAGTIAFY